MKRLLCNPIVSFFLILLIPQIICAQDFPHKEINPATLVDEIFATQNGDASYEDLYENYLQLLSNPLDLNQVTDEQLRALYILTPQQIQSLLNYRVEAGPFISEYELQNIEGFTKEIFLKLAPFVIVEDANSSFNKSIFKRIAEEKNNYLLVRFGQTLEPQKGYSESMASESRYTGSPSSFYSRFRTSRPADFSFGFTLKKDAGETLDWNPSKKKYGFDYTSIHAQVLNKGKLKNLIVGDYQAQFGQGIALGSVFGLGKNGEAVTTVRRSNLGFLPFTSIYEAGYFRGAALSYQVIKNFMVHTMVSSRGRDGNIQDSIQNTISSFSFTGLHRTATELANQNSLLETNLAVVANYKNKSLDAGILVHQTQFDRSFKKNLSPYNQFSFSGSENTNVGAFLNYSYNNFTFFSELVQTLNKGNALVAGALISLTPKLDVSLIYRKFDRNFYSFYSNALSENTVPQNESGVYWGWKYSVNKKVSLAGYVDLFQFPWLRFRSYSPSDGSEWLLRFNYRPSKNIYLFLQMREETKPRNTGEGTNLYLVQPGKKTSYWANIEYAATPQLNFKSRAQFSTYELNGKEAQGLAIMQDASLDWRKFSISGRYVLFDTDDFNNRQYVYEQDVWLAFSFPAYNGKGVRHYLLLQYQFSKKVDIYLRWAQTRYADKETIGTGGDTILGNTKNDVKFQIRFRL
jgi:hypothetical protein